MISVFRYNLESLLISAKGRKEKKDRERGEVSNEREKNQRDAMCKPLATAACPS